MFQIFKKILLSPSIRENSSPWPSWFINNNKVSEKIACGSKARPVPAQRVPGSTAARFHKFQKPQPRLFFPRTPCARFCVDVLCSCRANIRAFKCGFHRCSVACPRINPRSLSSAGAWMRARPVEVVAVQIASIYRPLKVAETWRCPRARHCHLRVLQRVVVTPIYVIIRVLRPRTRPSAP